MSFNIQSWDRLEPKRTNGIEKGKCPICHDTRKNKADKSLTIWHNSGTAKCFNNGCDALFFRDSVEKSIIRNNYTLPAQTWKNYTNLSERLVKWFETERKINQYTLQFFGISEELCYQPQMQKEVNNIVFNFFEGETVVNKKYRSGNKKFTQSKNGKPIMYNINAAIGCDEVYIVEGEMDVLALYEIGIKNAISLPSGANDNDNYWINSEPYLKDVKKFYIATDNDQSGEAIAEKIAQRLGRFRCERVLFENKDANGDLINGVLSKTIFNTKKYPVSGSYSTNELYSDLIELYNSGLPSCIEIKNNALKSLNGCFKLMYGQLCISTGIPSHGKSNFTEWLVLNILIENDVKASFFSPEHHPLQLHMSTFIQKAIGKNYFKEINETPRCTIDDINLFHDWANQKLYLTSPDSGQFATWNWLFEKMKEQIFAFGINIFVVDAWNKVEFDDNKKTERENINKTLSRLTQFAQQNNVLIIVVAHPTKMKKNMNNLYDEPTLYDVAGSSDFRNQTHSGYCIYRYFEDNYTLFRNLKSKYSFQGDIGAGVEFEYHIPSGRYYERGTSPQTHNLLLKQSEAEVMKSKELPKMNLVDAFGNNYDNDQDIPF